MKPRKPRGRKPREESDPLAGVRIIGGRFRGRNIQYSGDPRTRPMKDRVREALFNLVGTAVKDKHAIDLFAGTGALGLEALSRGAVRATFIEQHFPTARGIVSSARTLEVEDRIKVEPGSTFFWFRRHPDLGPLPWLVFCSPPYDFYVERTAELLGLIGGLIEAAPEESVFAVEADERFDFLLLPHPEEWDVRTYPPAVVGIYHKQRIL